MTAGQGLTRALAHRPFFWLWLGHTISAFGSSLHSLALVWWVIEGHGAGLAMGTVMICQLLPMIPFLLIGGALVDRLNRVRIMLVVDIVRGVLSGIVALLMALDRLELWHVYVMASAFGTANAFFTPAVSAVLPSVVPKEDRPSANSLRTLTRQLATVLGPMVAAGVIALGHATLAFAVDAATFFVSALTVLPLLRLNLSPRRSDDAGILADIRDGMGYVTRSPWLWISIVAFFFINGAGATVFAIGVPFIVTHVLHHDAAVFGIVEALASVGTIVAAWWIGRRATSPRRGREIYGWAIVTGIIAIAFALPVTIYGIAALSLIGGYGNAAWVLAWTSLMQDRVPAEQYGRVASIDYVGGIITAPIGFALVGWGLDRADPLLVCGIAGGLTVLAGALALLHPSINEIE